MLQPMEISAASETTIRLGCFLGVLVLLGALEALFPRRARERSRRTRWFGNLGISVLNQAISRLILPISALALAWLAEAEGWGVLNLVALPVWLEFIGAILALDLAIYLQHRLFHAVPLLWRLHRMHHADTEFDVSTGVRFHPLSVLLSAVIKLLAVLLIGPAAAAVLVFEILLNASSLFNHSNVHLPPRMDALIRRLIVTPDMHRIHHSSNTVETNSNFGFNFPWWDHLFRTYRAQPALGQLDMQVGLSDFRQEQELRLDRMLSQPFRGNAK